MRKAAIILLSIFIFSSIGFAQKGIDKQTETIKKDGNKKPNDNVPQSRSFDWGAGKTKVRERLPNPYKMNSRRDVLVKEIISLLSDNNQIVDESASRIDAGVIVTQPYVFAKGSVTARSELNRLAILPFGDTSWTRGRYTYTIDVQSIDGIQNNVYVTAKVEGRSGNGLISEWTTLQSSGVAEDVFLSKLVELMTGISPDASQKVDQ